VDLHRTVDSRCDDKLARLVDKSNRSEAVVVNFYAVLNSEVSQKLLSVNERLAPLPVVAVVWRWYVLLHSQH